MEEEQGEELEDDCNKGRQIIILFINKCFILYADNVRYKEEASAVCHLQSSHL